MHFLFFLFIVRMFMIIVVTVTPMPTMISVHKDMHERTGQQDQPYPVIADVRGMFCDQKISTNAKKENARQAKWGLPPRFLAFWFVIVFVIMFHF
tara:strand:+ start:11062 stop:11346 length:285 start_codon:yes stop_codon:yes gene_type:complete